MSDGLAYIKGQLYVSRARLIQEGVPENTVNQWTRSKRILRETLEPGGLHFCYATLSAATRAKLPFATAEEARWAAEQARIRQEAEAARQAQWGLQIALAHHVEAAWPAYKQAFLDVFGFEAAGHAEAERYARLQAALDWCLTGDHGCTRQQLLPAFQALRLVFCPGDGKGKKGGKGAYGSFCHKLKAYADTTDKIAVLVNRHKLGGNDNARKVKEAQTAWLVAYYRRADKPTIEETWAEYNKVAPSAGWPTIKDPRTVGNLLNERVPEWYTARHGVAAGKAKLGYSFLKKPVSAPDFVIEFDGTQEPFRFHNALGKEVGNLYVVRMWDIHSGCIVSSAYGETETAALIIEAYTNYILRWRRIPRQFRFDRGAANMSHAVQSLLEATGAVHFPGQAGRPKGRPSEQLLGLFQRTVQRKAALYRGPNITSNRNLDLQVNPERLDMALKQHVSFAEAKALALEMERVWNTSPARGRGTDRRSRLEKYEAPHESRQPLSLKGLAHLLFEKRPRPVRYTGNGLLVEADGTRLSYEVQHPGTQRPDLEAHYVNNGKLFEVWERRDGNRDHVLVCRTDRDEWQEMGQKYAYPLAVADSQPGEVQQLREILAADDALLKEQRATPEELAALADAGHTRLDKDTWNAANAAAEMQRIGRTRPPSRAAPAPVPPVSWPICDNRDGEGVELPTFELL